MNHSLSTLVSFNVLGAANPLDHVVDAPFLDGFLWHLGDDSAIEKFFLFLDSIGIGKHAMMFFLAGALTVRIMNADGTDLAGSSGTLPEINDLDWNVLNSVAIAVRAAPAW